MSDFDFVDWSKEFSHTIASLTTDVDGSLYATGIQGLITNNSFITKFKPDGTEEWTTILDSFETYSLGGVAIANDGSIYIAGSTVDDIDGQINKGGRDHYVTKFNSDGSKYGGSNIQGVNGKK